MLNLKLDSLIKVGKREMAKRDQNVGELQDLGRELSWEYHDSRKSINGGLWEVKSANKKKRTIQS